MRAESMGSEVGGSPKQSPRQGGPRGRPGPRELAAPARTLRLREGQLWPRDREDVAVCRRRGLDLPPPLTVVTSTGADGLSPHGAVGWSSALLSLERLADLDVRPRAVVGGEEHVVGQAALARCVDPLAARPALRVPIWAVRLLSCRPLCFIRSTHESLISGPVCRSDLQT